MLNGPDDGWWAIGYAIKMGMHFIKFSKSFFFLYFHTIYHKSHENFTTVQVEIAFSARQQAVG
jgi:hypothetical protein